MLLHKERFTGSASSGTLANTTAKFTGSILITVYAKPATATTTFDLKVTDVDSDIVFEETQIIGELSTEVHLPLYGRCTVTISNSSADEAFVVYLYAAEDRR